MNIILSLVYIILSFLFTTWLIASSGNYWWIVLLIFLLAIHPVVLENQISKETDEGDGSNGR